MRCGRAQRHLIDAAEGRLDARSRAGVERHVAGCAACREELRLTRALFTALGDTPAEATVPSRLEQATLRAVRLAAAEEAERAPRRWTGWLPVSALAVTATAAVAVAMLLRGGPEAPVTPSPARVAARPARPAAESVARAKPPAPTRSTAVARQRSAPPADPPPELAERPDLFIDLPILSHMEKLEHFEQIETTAVPDAPAEPAHPDAPSNG